MTDGLPRRGQTWKIKRVADRLRKKGFHIVAVSVEKCRKYECLVRYQFKLL